MNAYDEVPYDCQPIPWTAPEQLAISSLLHGGPLPPVRDARVLEVGCGDGANLLSMAFHRPDCRFVGVDSSQVQIEAARRSALRLGLANTTLCAADVRELPDEHDDFDYVIAHGVMSWVPDAVRDAILALCRERLTPNGLVYLSFNTYPGWLARGLVRDLMLGGSDPAAPLRERAAQARGRAAAVGATLQDIEHPYAQLMSRELSRVDPVHDSYLIHDYLSEHNRPYWFREFASLAAGFGFRYLAEAAFTQPDYRVPEETAEAAESLARDPLEREGLIDVMWYRQHRASLFCGEGASAAPGGLPIERISVASGLRPQSGVVDLAADVTETFHGPFEPDLGIEIQDPLAKAALTAVMPLWPGGLAWEQVFQQARSMLTEAGIEAPDADAARSLEDPLRELQVLGQLDLRLVEPLAAGEPGDPPTAVALLRWEAARRASVTTATHQRLPLTELDRRIVQRLDGSLARAACVDAVAQELREADADGEAAVTLGEVERRLDHCLELLGSWGLVV